MDFKPFDRELSGEDGMGCHCELCNQLKYAFGGLEDPAPHSAALNDALLSGKHVHVSWTQWTDKLRANKPGGERSRGYQASGSFMASGMGVGVTPGGVTGSTYRKGRS
ncbi:hypothetical protein ACF09Y_22575 [Streptomyces massasporeus]|uniref:hypothetical protein n=1 Tax=Streptomyces massasporeus TaxID=67324 RepID=UPI0037024679